MSTQLYQVVWGRGAAGVSSLGTSCKRKTPWPSRQAGISRAFPAGELSVLLSKIDVAFDTRFTRLI